MIEELNAKAEKSSFLKEFSGIHVYGRRKRNIRWKELAGEVITLNLSLCRTRWRSMVLGQDVDPCSLLKENKTSSGHKHAGIIDSSQCRLNGILQGFLQTWPSLHDRLHPRNSQLKGAPAVWTFITGVWSQNKKSHCYVCIGVFGLNWSRMLCYLYSIQ